MRLLWSENGVGGSERGCSGRIVLGGLFWADCSGRMVGYSETGPLPRWRSEVSLPMIHAVPQAVHLHLNRVHLAVFAGRTEPAAVFLAYTLCAFGEGAVEFVFIIREIDAPAA